MSWINAQIGSVLTKNRDGSDKPKPKFWMPPGKPIYIPEGTQNHARPVMIMNAEDPKQSLTLTLYRNQLVGHFQGDRKVLVELVG